MRKASFILAIVALLCILLVSFGQDKYLKTEDHPLQISIHPELVTFYKNNGNNELNKRLIEFTFKNIPFNYSLTSYFTKDGEKVNLDLYHQFKDDKPAQKYVMDNNFIFQYEKISDLKLIDHTILEDNLLTALDTWRSYPFSAKYDTTIFQKYIYPYRTYHEPLQNWRSYLYEKYSPLLKERDSEDPLEVCNIINSKLKAGFKFSEVSMVYPKSQNIYELEESGMGSCNDMVFYTSLVMKSLGLPVGRDFTPYWAHTHGRHSWNFLLQPNGTTVHFQGAEFNIDEHLLGTEYKEYFRMPKVYRNVFFSAKDPVDPIQYPGLPSFFYQYNIQDVTNQYLEAIDIQVDCKYENEQSLAFLCVYNDTWRPVDVGTKIADKQYQFHNIAKDVLYIVMKNQYGRLKPLSYPFHVTDDGEIKYFIPAIYETVTQAQYYNRFENGKKVAPQKKEKYQVAYWDDQWIYQEAESPIKVGKEFKMTVKLPAGALFKIQNTTLAKSRTRPFYMKNSKQHFF